MRACVGVVLADPHATHRARVYPQAEVVPATAGVLAGRHPTGTVVVVVDPSAEEPGLAPVVVEDLGHASILEIVHLTAVPIEKLRIVMPSAFRVGKDGQVRGAVAAPCLAREDIVRMVSDPELDVAAEGA